MRVKSIKFGGTSMGSSSSIMECADIVKEKLSTGDKIIVTVSAVGNTTDKLIAIINLARKSKPRLVKSVVLEIAASHKKILSEILNNHNKSNKVWNKQFQHLVDELKAISYGVSLMGDLTDKTVAKICAFGEKLSSLLIVQALNKKGIEAQRIESERIIKTDNNYLKAKVQFSSTNAAIRKIIKPLLNNDITPVVTGFIGKDIHGNITLLGRGGSDYTASIIAMGLCAKEIEIWTDVDGIMTADPNIVKQAYSWKNLDMHIMSEMAYSGAKVVHPDTIVLAVENDIPVCVYNTFNRKFQGTKITKTSQAVVKGLVSSPDSILLILENTSIINGVGFMKKVTGIFAEHNIPIDVCTTSEISLSISIKQDDYSVKLHKALESFASIKVKKNIAKLCFIGNQINQDNNLLSGIFATCEKQKVIPHSISVSASGNNITLLIDNRKVHLLINKLHDKFFTR